MKKFVVLMVCLALVLLSATSAFATKIWYDEDGWKHIDTSMDPPDGELPEIPEGTTWRNSDDMTPIPKRIDVYVNNYPLFPDVEPYLDQSNRTMIPVRYIAEALNSSVNWDGTDGKGRIDIKRKDKDLKLWINQKQSIIDGATIEMDTVPVLKNNRTMVPVRFVAQAFGADVLWNQGSLKVSITLHD